jgi:photosystem II stability/assembly factor-like uncharacterized protein
VTQIRRYSCHAFALFLVFLMVVVFTPRRAAAQQVNPDLYAGMRWRLIGPYRAGRVTAVAGIPGDPAVYYMGTPGGGVWKTTDGGTVWKPIFDAEHVAPIGALALAPSDPNVIYVGTGDLPNQAYGKGVYKSADDGKTWTHVGLADTLIINAIVVDPRNPDVVLVGAMGGRKASQARGVYKSTDGGKTWRRVLFRDDRTGVADLTLDPNNPRVAYATLWRFGSGRRGESSSGQDAWIYKSTDEGATWHPIPGHGLPAEAWGRTGIAIAPGHGGHRLYAILSEGLFRSDDAGATWRQITHDPRVVGNGYFSRVFVDPKNADVVYVMQTSLYRSTDGGRHFIALKGSPGGDDYHVMWIDPENPRRMILGVDQGAAISLDDGKTWIPWYNQPTGQFYHVTTGGGFPYFVYGQQQDSGSAAVPSRSDYGEIRYRDWFSPGGYEFGYIAVDPLHPDIDYVGGEAGSVTRFDRRTGQLTNLYIHGPEVRTSGNAPLLFSPLDPHALYFGAQYVMKSTDGAANWTRISPDLTERFAAGAKPNAGRRGVITTLAISPVAKGEIWAGTNDGLIWLSRNGGNKWQNVSPPDFGPRTQISIIEASHFDAAIAYAAVDRYEDSRPYFYRTRDFGKTWHPIDNGLPAFGIARVVREDPVRRGLLYAGTDAGVFVSFDDGRHWQSLQLDLHAGSVRDLAVHGSDLVAATFGRAFWILDDVTPLRQIDAARSSGGVYLYKPETAMRIRWDRNNDTPLPPEVPAGANPPDGAIIDYYLESAPAGPITLAIYDARGNLVRRFSSVVPPRDKTPANVPSYWFQPPASLPVEAGMNRFAWNLRYAHPDALASVLSRKPGGDYVAYGEVNHAILGKTPRHYPFGPQVVPGNYELALTVAGRTYRRSLVVKMDPRISASQAGLVAQLELEQKIARGMSSSAAAYRQVTVLHDALAEKQQGLASSSSAKDARDAADDLVKKLRDLEEGSYRSPGFAGVNHRLAELMNLIQAGDGRPTPSADATVADTCRTLRKDSAKWKAVATHDLPTLNRLLEKRGVGALPMPDVAAGGSSCAK